MDWLFSRSTMIYGQQLADRPARNPQGALHEPLEEDRANGGQVHGGIAQDRHIRKLSVYNSAAQHPILTSTVITAALAGAAAYLLLHESKPRTWRDRVEETFDDYAGRLGGYAGKLGSYASDYTHKASEYAGRYAGQLKSSAERVFG